MSPRRQPPIGYRKLAWWISSKFHSVAVGQALPPWDDYWYQRPGFDSAAGMAVSPETAMRLSAVYACVRVRGETFGSLPPIVYRRTANGDKERATNFPLYRVLHDQPNPWQTSMEFFEMMQGHLDLRGNAFARIIPGPRGAIDALLPLHPDLVQVLRLPNGRLKYQVGSRFDAEIDYYMQEEILHLRGLSSDGLVGLSPIALQRETIGKALGMQDYASRYINNDSRPPLILHHPGKFKDDAARNNFRESVQKSQTGENRGKMMVVEEGMTATELGVSNRDAQFIEGFKLSREEIAGIYRVPPHKIGILERSTHNNIEHQGIEFVTDCMRPIAVRWERRMNLDLIEPVAAALGAEEGEYFVEFLVDGLLRGDLKSRYEAYAIGRQNGWLSPNRICQFENMNRIPTEKGGDDYLRPANMIVAGSASPELPGVNEDAIPPNQPAPDAPDDPAGNAHHNGNGELLHAFAREAAGRVVRKEVTALRKALSRAQPNDGGFDASAFREETEKFYRQHAPLVAQTMCISPAAAESYARDNLNLVCNIADSGEKSAALDWIEDTAPDILAKIALGKKRAHRMLAA